MFPNQKVGSDYNEDAKNSLVYLLPYSTAVGKLYFHFWRGGSNSQENINFRRIEREWYKAQMIQSSYDGKTCRQSVKINDICLSKKPDLSIIEKRRQRNLHHRKSSGFIEISNTKLSIFLTSFINYSANSLHKKREF